jgi:hypothetical protein
MLVTDEKKLRWCGIDMHARWRRRVAVVLTYAAFVAVVWLHPWRIDRMPMVLFFGINLPGFDRMMADSIGTIARRTVLGAMFLGMVWLYWNHPAKPDRMICDIYMLLWIAAWSAVGYGRLVAAVWLRSSVRWWLGKRRRLGSLDDFARHYYGESFAALTEAQQMEVGRIERANPMGEWVMQGSGRYLTIQDERMRHEDDRVRAQAQRLMTWTLVCSAFVWSFANVSRHRSLSGDVIASWLWTMAALGLTLRQAIVLWTEDDPRVVVGEMELVEREA